MIKCINCVTVGTKVRGSLSNKEMCVNDRLQKDFADRESDVFPPDNAGRPDLNEG